MNIFTDQETIEGVKNIKNHENWGRVSIGNKSQIPTTISAINRSFQLMKEAIENNKNTGWYALTPREKLTESTDVEA